MGRALRPAQPRRALHDCRASCQAGQSIRQIAAALDRSPSTVSRELKRNGHAGRLQAGLCREQARARRWTGSRLERDAGLRGLVLGHLGAAGRPSRSPAGCAAERRHDDQPREHLPLHLRPDPPHQRRRLAPLPAQGQVQTRRAPQSGGSSDNLIKRRVSIDLRPASRRDTAHFGHWEADLMMFATPGQAVLHARTEVPDDLARPATRQSLATRRRAALRLVRTLSNPAAQIHHLRQRHRVRPAPSSSPTSSASGPSSAIPTAPGRRAPSKTPSDECDDPCRARPTSTPSTTTRRFNAHLRLQQHAAKMP